MLMAVSAEFAVTHKKNDSVLLHARSTSAQDAVCRTPPLPYHTCHNNHSTIVTLASGKASRLWFLERQHWNGWSSNLVRTRSSESNVDNIQSKHSHYLGGPVPVERRWLLYKAVIQMLYWTVVCALAELGPRISGSSLTLATFSLGSQEPGGMRQQRAQAVLLDRFSKGGSNFHI